jgi:hypothetical protein
MRTIQASLIFHAIYDDINGFTVSSKAKKNNQKPNAKSKFLYGEIPFVTWDVMTRKANPKKDGVFFDLGSGTGKAPILSHLLFDFKKSIGIEFLEGLHEAAREASDKIEKYVKPEFLEYLKDRELCFLNENIFDVNFADADFLFINFPLIGEKNYLALEEKLLRELKPKTKIIATIRELKNPAFKRFHHDLYNFSWGRADAYFYEI